ncbi:MAG: hypothetical protein AB1730_25920 [Myxococcota bacterium]|jgi:hypothetical protein
MGTFKSFMESKGLTGKQLAITSKRIESLDAENRELLHKRALKRADKEQASKKYEELGLKKPNAAGRGVTEVQIAAAMADKAVSRKVRSKILRAVNTILVKKGEPAADMKALFEGTKARVGAKPATKK